METDDPNEAASTGTSTRQSAGKSAKDHKTSQQLCEEMGITNVEIEYTQENFQNLVTYKLFNQHIRPLLLEKNPKLVMYKMVSIIGAKWREFIELKEQFNKNNNNSSAASNSSDTSKSTESKVEASPAAALTPTETTAESASNRSGRGRSARAAKRGAVDYNENDEPSNNSSATPNTTANATTAADEAAIAAAAAELEDSSTRRSSRQKKTTTSTTTKSKNDESPPPPASSASDSKTRKSISSSSSNNVNNNNNSNANQSKTLKKRKRRDEDGGGGYNDSDAEFEAMLEEQCRMEEKEKEKKKQRQAAKKEEAAVKAAKSSSKLSKPSGGAKIKNSADPDPEFDNDQHQDFCEVCQQGGEIILCDTCPRAYHLVCLEPELEEAPDGEWFCPQCEKDGVAATKKAQVAEAQAKAAVDQDGINHLEFCFVCKDGGELLCCETCPQSYHIDCLNPPLGKIPSHEWYCFRCTCEKPKAPVKKILNWRWKADDKKNNEDQVQEEENEIKKKKKTKTPLLKIKLKKPSKNRNDDDDDENSDKNESDEENDDEENENESEEESDEDDDESDELDESDDEETNRKSKRIKKSDEKSGNGTAKTITTSYKKDPNQLEPVKHVPQKLREFFVKYDGLSYWHCDWISETSVEVHHKILWRNYTTRNDMQMPPSSDSLVDKTETDEDKEDDVKYYDAKLDKTYYKNGVRPPYLQIHRVLNYKKTNRGDEWYLIKWRDLGYEQSTWELDGGDIAVQIHDWKKQCDLYWSLKKYITESDEREAKIKASKSAKSAKKVL